VETTISRRSRLTLASDRRPDSGKRPRSGRNTYVGGSSIHSDHELAELKHPAAQHTARPGRTLIPHHRPSWRRTPSTEPTRSSVARMLAHCGHDSRPCLHHLVIGTPSDHPTTHQPAVSLSDCANSAGLGRANWHPTRDQRSVGERDGWRAPGISRSPQSIREFSRFFRSKTPGRSMTHLCEGARRCGRPDRRVSCLE